MTTTITRNQLASALFSTQDYKNGTRQPSGPLHIGRVAFTNICSVQREDGSGHNYNVTGYTPSGEQATVFCRTVD